MEQLIEEFEELVFEVSKFRSDILKDIDKNFSQIKQDKTNKDARKQLVENIRKFTGVKNIILSIKKDYYNAAVIPIYTQVLALDLLNVFKKYEAGENIKSLDVVEETPKYIQKIYIIFGDELINGFSSRELTAILLHELGHSFTYTANLPRILLVLFQKGIGIAGLILKTPILWILNLVSLPAYLISSLILMTVVRSLTFLEHKSEYKADQFPAKYGYGDEMIKVLYKLHHKEIEREESMSWFDKIWEFIGNLFAPSTHPKSSRRIKEVNEQMLSDYKKLYPKLSNELSIILKDIKSS